MNATSLQKSRPSEKVVCNVSQTNILGGARTGIEILQGFSEVRGKIRNTTVLFAMFPFEQTAMGQVAFSPKWPLQSQQRRHLPLFGAVLFAVSSPINPPGWETKSKGFVILTAVMMTCTGRIIRIPKRRRKYTEISQFRRHVHMKGAENQNFEFSC